jgi:hypothetical protein
VIGDTSTEQQSTCRSIQIDPYISYAFRKRGEVLWKLHINGQWISDCVPPFLTNFLWVQFSIHNDGTPAWHGVACRRIPGAYIWYNHPGYHYMLSDSITCPDVIDTNELLIFDEASYTNAIEHADLTSRDLIAPLTGSHLFQHSINEESGVVYEPTPWEDVAETNNLQPNELNRVLQCLWLPNVTFLKDAPLISSCLNAPRLVASLKLCFARGEATIESPSRENPPIQVVFPVYDQHLRSERFFCRWETATGNHHYYVRFLQYPHFPIWLKIPFT